MKKSFILLLLLGGIFSTTAQTGKTTVITRYFYFTGAIDKYPVTFHLYRINDQFTGWYCYNSSEEPIDVWGSIDKSNFLKLEHEAIEGNATNGLERNVSEVLSGTFKDSSWSGTWSHKGKLLPFRISTPKNNNLPAFDYIYTTGSKKLTGIEHERQELSYDAASVWPAASTKHTFTDTLKNIIYNVFGETAAQDPIGKVMIREKNSTLDPARLDKDGPTYSIGRRVRVIYQNTRLLTLSNYTYADNGGAHGNHGIGYICLDLVNNRRLTITDVLDTVSCGETLRALLVKKFRAVYHVKKEEKVSEYLFHDVIPVSDNIMLTAKGIGFNYVPYEIGAYALGDVFLYIPYKELDSCLTPSFKKLIGITSQ